MSSDQAALRAAILRGARNGQPQSKVAAELGLSTSRISQVARKLGIDYRSNRFWSEAELHQLKLLAPTHTARQIAEKLDRTDNEVRQQLSYRKIKAKDGRAKK